MKTLFILKLREDYAEAHHNSIRLSTGLYNSANFVHEMLVKNGVDSKIVVVVDNNSIDREVTLFRPDIVIIEALWVVPDKFSVLKKLHPNVKWIVRIHSDIPFMSCEGIAMDWILDYMAYDKVRVAPNSPKMVDDVITIGDAKFGLYNNKEVIYLPNYYPTKMTTPKSIDYNKKWVDISSFGAIRPLKNQLLQAVAAIGLAQQIDKNLRFHMNAGRIEANGAPAHNNLRGLFQHLDQNKYQLILHKWATHENFLDIISNIDIGMQVSFSETFNIVGADHVSQGVAFLGCDEIPWYLQGPVSYNDTNQITNNLFNIYTDPTLNITRNQNDLIKYSESSEKIWLQFLEKERA